MTRSVLNFLWRPSLIGCVAIGWLWLRGTSGVDSVSLMYDRYQADGRAASNAIQLTADHRLWLNIMAGSVAPYDGQLVWGYHLNADTSQGVPRFQYERSPYATNIFSFDGRMATDDRAMSGWGPFRWQDFRRAGNTEEFRSVTIGVSYWLPLILLSLLPLRRLFSFCRAMSVKRLAKTTGEPSQPLDRRCHALLPS